ncbi:MAG TPA: SAM-dependent methyltransferase [Betaproteobacteria bacterium]|nr:SAM-dependent methyltransferase [Betaproteobacteria bacterium]
MKEFWNERYATEEYVFGAAPNTFLASQEHRLPPAGSALAVADGEGRNAVWLAKHGLDVLSLDISPVAQEKARALAVREGVAISTELADILTWPWETQRFDLIAAIFVQVVGSAERPVFHRRIQAALKPGGLLILQGYTPKQLEYKTGGPSNVDNLYTADMLAADFAAMEILHLREHEDIMREGKGHNGMSALVDIVARKQ